MRQNGKQLATGATVTMIGFVGVFVGVVDNYSIVLAVSSAMLVVGLGIVASTEDLP